MRDYQQELTDGIIAALERGVAPWQKPWNQAAPQPLPYNPTTGKQYQGANVLCLMTVAANNGYGDPRWLTYKQAQEHGWQVQRGQHGTSIVYWKRTELVKTKDLATGEEQRIEVAMERPRVFHAVVFNAAQVRGLPPGEGNGPVQQAWEIHQRAESILVASRARIFHDGGNRAFYRESTDDIHLPVRGAFPDAGGYYGTALHELGHWTGHPSRLTREMGKRFGDTNYAREELRAEIASLFLSAQIGVPHDPERHASYVGSWIKVLKDDKHEIFRAGRDAGKIADYVLAFLSRR